MKNFFKKTLATLLLGSVIFSFSTVSVSAWALILYKSTTGNTPQYADSNKVLQLNNPNKWANLGDITTSDNTALNDMFAVGGTTSNITNVNYEDHLLTITLNISAKKYKSSKIIGVNKPYSSYFQFGDYSQGTKPKFQNIDRRSRGKDINFQGTPITKIVIYRY